MEPQPSDRWERRLPWLGAALGLLWFLALGGAPALDPTNLHWLGGGDHAQHTLGWLHFRNAPWSFPLGSIPSLMHPIPLTVGFTDSNPWVALALKPFSRWMPQDFQFIGPWLALCLALQGWMGVKLMGLFTRDVPQRLLGAALFVLSPVLLFRFGHDTLCAHWLLLAMLWLHLRPREDVQQARRTVGQALALNVLAAGIHPYLEAMVLTLTVALLFKLVRRERLLSWRFAGAALATTLGVVGALFVAFGYVGQGISTGTNGFSYYSADLLAPINPSGASRMMDGFPMGSGQYEGFGYIGTGFLALAAVVLLWSPWRSWPRVKEGLGAQTPLLLSVLALSVLAFSSVVTVTGRPVLTWRALAEPLLPLLAPFRSSGRFIWLLDYALMTGLVALVTWRWRQSPRVVTALLLGAVLLQALDTNNLWARSSFHKGTWPRLQAPEWERVDPFYRHIVLFPPAIVGARTPCVSGTFPDDAYVHFGDLAYRKGMTTNSAYAARLDEARVASVCEALRAEVESGRFAEDTLYVVGERELESFRRPEAGLTCGVLDGYTVCVSAKQGGFQEALTHAPPMPPPVSGSARQTQAPAP